MNAAQQAADHAGALLGALLRGGVTDAVVSPGSRSTPLVLALHARADQVRVHVVLDERTAAFVALGLARVQRRPVVLIATSGSAGGHWLPAVIEASRSRIPLLLLTADRPVELQEHGAAQTVPQHNLFSLHVRLFQDLGAPSGRVRWLATAAARALDAATGVRPGPVHLNLPFRKPLWEPGVASEGPDLPLTRLLRGTPRLDDAQLDALAKRLAGAARGVIVCGPRDLVERGDAPPAHLLDLADRLGWPVLAEPTSGARWSAAPSRLIISHADALLRATDIGDELVPDLILRIGQVPTSPGLAGWVARHGEGRTVLVDSAGDWQDPDHVAELCVVAAVEPLCEALSDRIPERTATFSWLERWRVANRTAAAVVAHHGATATWSGAVARALVTSLPAGALLHVGSSTAVRALDTFGGDRAAHLAVSSSRGANGIDGTLATTLGQALAWSSGPVVTLLGELTFLHDLGSLRAAVQAGARFTAVILDNHGGGIFRQLPVAAHPTALEPLFTTPQDADLLALATASGAVARRCASLGDLQRELRASWPHEGVTVLVVPFDAAFDGACARDALTACADAVREALGLPAEPTATGMGT